MHGQLDDAEANALERLGHDTQMFGKFGLWGKFESIGTHMDVSGIGRGECRRGTVPILNQIS